jgi:protein arginine kinase
MEIEGLADHAGEWLRGEGPESDIVISSRVRLARNLAEFPFVPRCDDVSQARIRDVLRRQIVRSEFTDQIRYVDLEESDEVDTRFLVERHLISRELAAADGPRGVAFGANEVVSIMVNEEDHLRIQALRSGLSLEDSWEEARRVDDLLEKEVPFAFHSQFGYLTSCPTNVGTGLRVSVMLHLPALVYTKQIEKVFHAVSKINLTVRGLYGEGTQASGDFYQISNQVTLGLSEAAILENVSRVVPKIIAYERNIREHLLQESRVSLEDRVWRAFGLLTSARLISSEETMEQLSMLRLGINTSLVPELPIRAVNELFILIQPGHLQKVAGRELDQHERDEARATFIRDRLTKASA